MRNFERWLLQRGVSPDGKTAPAQKVDISTLKYNYPSGRGYEFHSRRTDIAQGSRFIYSRLQPRFLSSGPHRLWLKVTYVDGLKTAWRVEYKGTGGVAKTPPVRTAAIGKWKTATFETDDMTLPGDFTSNMDFRLAVTGESDLSVMFVRSVKPSAPITDGS